MTYINIHVTIQVAMLKKKIKKNYIALFRQTIKIINYVTVKMLGVLPLFLRTNIKENLDSIAIMDYPKKDIKMSVDSRIELKRLRACGEEPETVDWIAKNRRPGDVFYDIGASVGAYSFIFFAEAGGDCAVYAFEPNPFTFSSLSKNILLNGMEEKITAELSSQGFQRVLTFTLDDLAEKFGLKYPNMLKIDVDGAESNVIEGAKKILASNELRHILVEIDERIDTHTDTISKIKNSGFNFISKSRARKSGKKVPVVFNYIFSK
ncbi:MAG: Methyltransferase FkbM family [Parcubacteria group bacterium GW2011_GWA2_44_13]|nr:MAG: Methyltransferase FkbM family [Parcubacteria group bacterium GW2011_GWA2_44_13]